MSVAKENQKNLEESIQKCKHANKNIEKMKKILEGKLDFNETEFQQIANSLNSNLTSAETSTPKLIAK